MDILDAAHEVELPDGPAPLTPEARRRRLIRSGGRIDESLKRLGPGSTFRVVCRRVFDGLWNDGFIHAGNIAFLTLLTVFPFFICVAAIANAFGRTEDSLRAVQEFLQQVPASVADVLAKPISDVLQARSGTLLWLGALVGLWTTGGFIATIKDIIYRAYGVRSSASLWRARLNYTLISVLSVLLILVSFLLQAMLTAVQQFVARLLPFADQTFAVLLTLSRFVPGLFIFGALYLLFYATTPKTFRGSGCRKWPGPLVTALWWLLVTALMPVVLGMLGSYDLTYGSLAGVTLALTYFFIIGLGLVVGAHLNAALAEAPEDALKAAQPHSEEAPT